MPFTYTVMLIGTIALLGLPWLSGFYSKDLILELAYGNYQFSSLFAFILGTLTAFLTAFYSVRLINLVYLTIPNAKKTFYLNIPNKQENSIVIVPLSILALFAIFLGFIASDFVGIGSDLFGNSLFYHPSHLNIIEAEFSLPIYIKLMPTVLSLLGGGFAIYLYHYGHYFLTGGQRTSLSWPAYAAPSCASVEQKVGGLRLVETNFVQLLTLQHPLLAQLGVGTQGVKTGVASPTQPQVQNWKGRAAFAGVHLPTPKLAHVIIKIYTFLNGKYLLDILYNNYLISGGLKLGYTISKLLDKGIIELIGPYGLTEGSYTASASLNKLDTGVITTYALFITLGLISILFILLSLSVPLFYNGSSVSSSTTLESLTMEMPKADKLTILEQMQTNYTLSLKIVLLSIFSIYITVQNLKSLGEGKLPFPFGSNAAST